MRGKKITWKMVDVSFPVRQRIEFYLFTMKIYLSSDEKEKMKNYGNSAAARDIS